MVDSSGHECSRGLSTIHHRSGSDDGVGLMLVQTPAEQGVLNIQGQLDAAVREDLDDWQKLFSKQFYNIFLRVGRIRNYKVQP